MDEALPLPYAVHGWFKLDAVLVNAAAFVDVEAKKIGD
jgi:hypothetical protein